MLFPNRYGLIKSAVHMIFFLILFAGCTHDGQEAGVYSQNYAGDTAAAEKVQPIAKSKWGKGLLQYSPGAFEGYTLFAPMSKKTTYLIDMYGNVVHTWESKYRPGISAYLLENGDLLRTGQPSRGGQGGSGGNVQRISWDGELVWDFSIPGDKHRLHHDIAILPNGNVLMISWDDKSKQETIDAGRSGGIFSGAALSPDMIIEVKPTGKTTGDIVWEWHVWDHLVQDTDPEKANYGVVADHPELLDINYSSSRSGRSRSDWNHCNAVAYNEKLDQIILSFRAMSEIYIIDHSTTTEEAKGHTGGRYGKGGDILYRWGNPRVYQRGNRADRTLFEQHDPVWIEKGYPGEGNITIFNNGTSRSGGYSSIEEITPPIDENGNYIIEEGSAFGPVKSTWTYTASIKSSFYADHISGSQRLPNGNTLICSGPKGTFFEVTPEGKTVWKYVNPFLGTIRGGGKGASPVDVFRAYRYAMDYPGIKK